MLFVRFVSSHIFFALLLLSAPLIGISRESLAEGLRFQDSNKFTEVDLKVQAVGLGTSYTNARRRLGKPQRTRRQRVLDETCGPPYTRMTLFYPGMSLELHGTLNGRAFKVISVEVTSPVWMVEPGIRIGMEERVVRKRLGVPANEEAEAGLRRLYYSTKGDDGGVMLEFRASKLMRMQWSYSLC